MALETPVAFFLFNRPDLTQIVFEAVARQRPRTLLLVADGPRSDAERVLCEQAREVVSRVDWPCEVLTEFSPQNLGCKRRVSSGLDWVFSQVPEAIVLEDDCLPAPSFFPYCQTLLARYRDDERVMHISGDNFQKQPRTPNSYYFSRYVHVWGWASWSRAWKHYDVKMTSWPQRKSSLLASCSSARERTYWVEIFDAVHAGAINTWDYQWFYTCWNRGALAAMPEVNLVSNLGFRADGTHTRSNDVRAHLPLGDLGELRHPPVVQRNEEADALALRQMLPSFSLRRAASRLKEGLGRRLLPGRD